jgi:hypothetical protein
VAIVVVASTMIRAGKSVVSFPLVRVREPSLGELRETIGT